MSNKIVKQPNGLYAVWSTVTNSFIAWNGSASDVINLLANKAARAAAENRKESARKEIEAIEESNSEFFKLCLSTMQELETVPDELKDRLDVLSMQAPDGNEYQK